MPAWLAGIAWIGPLKASHLLGETPLRFMLIRLDRFQSAVKVQLINTLQGLEVSTQSVNLVCTSGLAHVFLHPIVQLYR